MVKNINKAIRSTVLAISLLPSGFSYAQVDSEDQFARISVFSLGMVGFAGHISSEEVLYKKTKATPKSGEYFKKIVKSKTATVESKMYAMCGLRDIDRKSFFENKKYFTPSLTVSTMKGDVLSREGVADVLYRIEKFGCQ